MARPLRIEFPGAFHHVMNRSMWLDLKIILKTVWTMVSGKGAC